ncbi:hypothetical protein JCM10207_001036 [Rhodosporidiobolus poonsookiae]
MHATMPLYSTSQPSPPLLAQPSFFAPSALAHFYPSALSSLDDFTRPSAPERRASNGSTGSLNSSAASDDDDSAYPTGARTSPDLSSLTPSAALPSASPLRAPGLSAPSSPSSRSGFALSRSSSPAGSPAATADADEEDEDDAPITPLPRGLPRPKTKLDRERERSLGLNGAGQKREGLGKKLARKRADSLKWAKYANVGTFEVELGLSNEDLRRT